MSLFTSPTVGQPEEQQQAQQQQFQPQWDEKTLRRLIKEYEKNPTHYPVELKESIKQHAAYYNMPMYEGEFDLLDAFKHAGAGFFEGFTTFNLMEPADNEYEQIFRNLGHLAGFAPGLLAVPARALTKLGVKSSALKSWARTASALNDKSVPMAGAKWLTGKAKNIVQPAIKAAGLHRGASTNVAVDFLMGNRARHMMEGAFHLGAASAISSWQGGVDEMMHSFMGGAVAGGVFRGVGNLKFAETETGNKVIRGMAGSLFMGLPSTMRGATTPEQIYEYVLGAYFGKGEKPWREAKAHKFVMQDMPKRAQTDPKFRNSMDPEIHPKWEDLPPEVQPLVKKWALSGIPGTEFKGYGPPAVREFMNSVVAEINPEKLKEIPAEVDGFQVEQVKGEGGEPQLVIKKGVLDKYKHIHISGAAEGPDRWFAEIAFEKGMPSIHYTFGADMADAQYAKGFKRPLRQTELDEANPKLARASARLDRPTENLSQRQLNYILRDWYQVKHSSAIYAVAPIETEGPLRHKAVKGGTGWTVEMAISNKKSPIYVFDEPTTKWWKYDRGAGFFKPLKGLPPKPPRQFAGIGSRQSTEVGKQAIREFMDAKFPEGVRLKPTKEQLKEIEDAEKTGKKVLKPYRKELEVELDELNINMENVRTQLIDIYKEVNPNFNPEKGIPIPTNELSAQHKDAVIRLENEGEAIRGRMKEIVSEIETMDKTGESPMLDAATGEIIVTPEIAKEMTSEGTGDVSQGNVGTRVKATMPILEFVDTKLKGIWGTAPTSFERNQMKADLSEQIAAKLMEVSVSRKNKFDNQSDKFIEWINDFAIKQGIEEGFGLDQESRGTARQWIAAQNWNKQVTHFGAGWVKGGFDIVELNPIKDDAVPFSMGGESKQQREPMKIIERMMREELGFSKKDGVIFGVLDHITMTEPGGKKVDMEFARFEDHLYNKYRFDGSTKTNEAARAKAQIKMYEYKSRIQKKMLEKGMHYFSGRGESDRMYFIKFNPLMERLKSSERKPLLNEMLRIGKLGDGYREMRKRFISDYTEKQRGLTSQQAGELFDKAYLSSIIYDIQLNGFEPQNTAQLMKDAAKFFSPEYDIISESKAFNKRSQVWHTNGYPGDAVFIANRMAKGANDLYFDSAAPTDQLNLFADKKIGKLNYILVNDLPEEIRSKSPKWFTEVIRKSTELPEHVDGAIITRDDVIRINNEDAGMPELFTQNKSFIASRKEKDTNGNPLGGLLGKYMMHPAGKRLSKYMEDYVDPKTGVKGLHYIMMGSSVKQRGMREAGDYSIGRNKLMVKDAPMYHLNPHDIYYNYSVKNHSEMLSDARIAKQLLSAFLDNQKSPVPKEIIDDMLSTIMGRRFNGTEYGNKLFSEFKTSTLAQKQQSIDKLMKNWNKLSIPDILEGIRNPDMEMFAERAFERMIFGYRKELNESLERGELTESEFALEKARLEATEKDYDRKIKSAELAKKQAKKDGVDLNTLGVYFDPAVRRYREQVIRSFVVREITKPRTSNSAVARMRPYDKALQMDLDGSNPNLKRLDKDEFMFVLDNAYKDMKIKTDNNHLGKDGEITLGELWKLKEQKSELLKNVDINNLLRATVLRVPMSSMSGARVLNFGGFSGREGHGVLLHSRVMRNLGGADLDADEAWVFFGGEKHGFKKKWQDAIDANRKEFFTEDGKYFIDAKESEIPKEIRESLGLRNKPKIKTMRDFLTVSGEFTEAEKNLLKSRGAMYSLHERMRQADAAIRGRNQLGEAAVNPKQLMMLTHSMVSNNKDQNEWIDVSRPVWGPNKLPGEPPEIINYRLLVKARTSDKWRNWARQIGRAQIEFSADPMDELGMKSTDFWFKELFRAHFNVVKVIDKDNPKRKLPAYEFKNLTYDKLKAYELKRGTYNVVREMNNAFWGKDWSTNRGFLPSEIKDLASKVYQLSENQQHNFLSQVGIKLGSVNFSDNLLTRVDYNKVTDMYNQYNEIVKKYDGIKKLLGRSSLSSPMWVGIRKTLRPLGKDSDATLLNPDHIISIANDMRAFKKAVTINGDWKSINKKHGLKIDEILLGEARGGKFYSLDTSVKARIKILSKIARTAEEYFIQNVGDMASFDVIQRLVRKMETDGETIDNAKIADLHKFAEKLKKDNYLSAKVRKQTAAFDWSDLSPKHLKMMKAAAEDPDFQRLGLLPPGVKILQQKPSAYSDRMKVDRAIRKKKENLTTNEKMFLDYLILGTFRRGAYNKIVELEAALEAEGELPSALADVLSNLKRDASKTNLGRLGINSKAVNDKSLTDFTRSQLEHLDTSWKAPKQEELNNAHKKIDNVKETIKRDNNGDKIMEDEFEPWVNTTTGYEGLKEGVQITDVPEAYRARVIELVTNIKGENPKFRKNLNEVIRSLIGKDLNALNANDYTILNNWFKEVKRGTWLQRFFSKEGVTELSKRHHWFFPKTVNRELMRDEIRLMEEEGLYLTNTGEVLTGKLMRPTHFVDMAQSWIARTLDSASEVSDKWVNEIKERLLFVNSVKEGDVLRQIAVRERELGYFTEYIPSSLQRKLTVDERVALREYQARHDELIKHHSDKLDKIYTIEVDGKRVELTGKEFIKRINNEYTTFFEKMHRFIIGEKTDESGINHALEQYRVGWRDRKNQKGAIYKHEQFIEDLRADWRKGKKLVTDIGIDGLRAMARSMMIEMSGKHPDFQKELKMYDVNTTGKMPFKHYFPHMFFNKKIAGEGMKKHWDALAKMDWKEFHPTDRKKAEKIRTRKMNGLIWKNHTLTGDWTFEDAEEWKVFDQRIQEFAEGKANKSDKVDWFSNRSKAGSMHSRKGHIPGWSVDATVVEGYSRALVNTYHRQLAQILGRDIINRMNKMGDHYVENKAGRKVKVKGKWNKDQVEAWQKFMKLYIQDAIGNPSVIPEDYYKDPKMKLQGTPYAWWADNRVEKKINKVLDNFGLSSKDLPKELRGVDMQQLRHWSNLEAQYEMASLLAHPKSMVTNIFGGTMHTVESAGWRSWKNARNIDWLKQNINSKWNSMEDVMKFVVRSGVYPEYMIYEAGLNKEMKQARNKEFIEDIAKRLTKDPEMKDTTLKEIAKQYGVKDRVVQFAAKFMTVPERMIRRDAFMSHYIQAWERWGGAIKDPEHPFLIEQAKKGVRATQFLYNAPFRPAFARTALGKVMTRFQLWSWNAVRFRNDVARQAKIYGITPGTEAYERYARMMQMDVFVFALANMFAYSLFETALPAPWNWLQDTADWIFGNEEERDRAFFGQWPKQLAPLQMVTPPILRLLPSSMRAMVDDDWSKVGKYYVWTMFPFGRMARDVVGPGNLIENPIRVLEKTTGFPLLQLQKKGTEYKKEQEEGTRIPSPSPGKSIF